MPDRIPVLLDTDPGNDIDDVLAIAYLLMQPRCELVGITTTTGDVAKRAAIAKAVCNSVGRTDVPIVGGRNEVLAYGPGQPQVPQYEAIENTEHCLDYPENQAVDFLSSKIHERPGEIVLLTIGPLPNIGLLFGLEPELPKKLKSIVSMAGAFFGYDNSEWNCVCDPVGTAMTAKAERPDHTWFGLDVTMQCRQSADVVRATYTGEPLATILPMAEIFFRHSGHIIYHDPLAVACLFEPDICTYQTGKVTVDPADGKTFFAPGEGNDKVAATVAAERFFDHFFGTIKGIR